AYLGCGDLPGPLRRLQPACPVAVAIARGLALSALVTFAPKLVARFRLQHLLDDQPHREANQLRTVSLRPQPSIDERPKPLACLLRRRYSLHHGMLPEGLRRQPKARSPASLRQGASQTFFQQIYAFTIQSLATVQRIGRSRRYREHCFAPLDLFHSFTTLESYNGDGFQRFFFRILRPPISRNIRAF